MDRDNREEQSLIEQNEVTLDSNHHHPQVELNEHLLKQFIRLALFADVDKIPLKREDFVKKVLKEQSREFQLYLEAANRILRDVLGMELVEFPPIKDSEYLTFAESSHYEPSSRHPRSKPRRSNTYILRSTLELTTIREFLCRRNEYAEKGFLLTILTLIVVHHQKLMEGNV